MNIKIFINIKIKLKKNILKIVAPSLALVPIISVVSCSKEEYSVSSNVDLYSTIWNLSLENDIKNSIFDMNIKELEEKINSNLKRDSKNNLIMKIYSFYLLWQAIKNPLSPNGQQITNQSTDIESFSTFLTDKLSPDNKDVDDDKSSIDTLITYLFISWLLCFSLSYSDLIGISLLNFVRLSEQVGQWQLVMSDNDIYRDAV